MQKENTYLEDILYNLGFEQKDGKLKNRLNFSGYKINSYFTEQLENWVKSIEEEEEEDKDLIKEIYNFISFYYRDGDFGFFKKKYDNYTYRIEYKGEDTRFIWSSKDSYFVKTSDTNNNFEPNLNDLFDGKLKLIFTKQYDSEKQTNTVEIVKQEETYFVNIYNISLKKGKSKKEETKNYLLDQIEEKLNNHFKDDRGTLFIKQYKDKELKDFFDKWGKDYFIHKKISRENLKKNL